MKDMVILVIKIVIVILLVAAGFWYSWSVYTECRKAGGGALLCWHIMGRK